MKSSMLIHWWNVIFDTNFQTLLQEKLNCKDFSFYFQNIPEMRFPNSPFSPCMSIIYILFPSISSPGGWWQCSILLEESVLVYQPATDTQQTDQVETFKNYGKLKTIQIAYVHSQITISLLSSSVVPSK